MSEETEEQAVIDQVLRGHKQLYSILVDRYKHQIYGILRGMGASHQDAQDVTQDTFINAYRKLAHHQRERSFAGWLYRIALNLWRDHLRKPMNRLHEMPVEEPREDATPEDDYIRKEFQMEMHAKLHELPEDYRLVLLLRYTNDLSYEEIGDITGMSPNKVRNCLHRAKKRLQLKWMNEEVGRYEVLE